MRCCDPQRCRTLSCRKSRRTPHLGTQPVDLDMLGNLFEFLVDDEVSRGTIFPMIRRDGRGTCPRPVA